MKAYYNEFDNCAAEWLRQLIAVKALPAGHVDERSIKEVQPDDLKGYSQCHFFAGIGGWAYALQLAGWPDDVPVWTGSCPCQPLSCAGQGKGEMDERHLWPDFYRLIAQCRPATIFGEQVASSDGREWLDGISLDLEELGYAIGAADLPAACVGAPHRRQRLWWVADSDNSDQDGWPSGRQQPLHDKGGQYCDAISAVADTAGVAGKCRSNKPKRKTKKREIDRRNSSRLEDAPSDRRQQGRTESNWWGVAARRGSDGFYRRLEPGLEPLSPRLPGRLDILRGYGNAIVPQVAARFIQAYLETKREQQA